MIFSLDLEGVLAPEMWPRLGEHFGVPDFSLTTRDLADFDELMRRRVASMRSAGLTLRDLQAVAHTTEPYLGSREFLSRLRLIGQVIVISDSFHELADPLLEKLGGYNLFANRFEMNGDGHIRGFKLRIRGQKERLVAGFQAAGFPVAAVGDSLNDLSILQACDFPVLYRPVESLRTSLPQAAVAMALDEALDLLRRAAASFDAAL
jgi:phosphoserine/homoserine phosphotransferase